MPARRHLGQVHRHHHRGADGSEQSDQRRAPLRGEEERAFVFRGGLPGAGQDGEAEAHRARAQEDCQESDQLDDRLRPGDQRLVRHAMFLAGGGEAGRGKLTRRPSRDNPARAVAQFFVDRRARPV